MLRFQEKLGKASERVLNISLWKPRGGAVGSILGGKGLAEGRAGGQGLAARETMPDDVLDAISCMIKDINSTQHRIGVECEDQMIMLEALHDDIQRSHARLHNLTKQIERKLLGK